MGQGSGYKGAAIKVDDLLDSLVELHKHFLTIAMNLFCLTLQPVNEIIAYLCSHRFLSVT